MGAYPLNLLVGVANQFVACNESQIHIFQHFWILIFVCVSHFPLCFSIIINLGYPFLVNDSIHRNISLKSGRAEASWTFCPKETL